MTSVPLHCHICPKRPDFSDISHLLTHVGSKGHLSHYFKAQVRGRQDASVRQQIETYDQWYEDNQIEKLLSQRMILKDSKKPNGIARATDKERSVSAKPTKTSKKKATTKAGHLPAEAGPEAVIDPQLSQQLTTPLGDLVAPQPSNPTSSPGFDLTSMHHAPFPRMHSFPTPRLGPAEVPRPESKYLATSTGVAPAAREQMAGSDTESEGEASAVRNCKGPSYPDPPTTEAFFASIATADNPSTRRLNGRGRPRHVRGHEDAGETEEPIVPRTPELKGVCYPGMSLFDSASAEAQRKRNQRKNDSILAQIQQESLEVECNEYIYWPDGALKMCRFITGDVQSSPFKEDTPPSPPPKRRRGRKPKNAGPDVIQKRLKTVGETRVADNEPAHSPRFGTNLTDLPELPTRPAMGRNLLSPIFDNQSAYTEDVYEEWPFQKGEPASSGCRLSPVFLGQGAAAPVPTGDPIKPHPNPLKLAHHNPHSASDADIAWPMTDDSPYTLQQQASAITRSLPSRSQNHHAGLSGQPILGASQSHTHMRPGNNSLQDLGFHESNKGEICSAKTLDLKNAPNHMKAVQARSIARTSHTSSGIRSGKENLPPPDDGQYMSGSAAKEDDPKEVQRYFVIKDQQRPQISSRLPAEMAFAGMRTPPVYRASLNPLNPNAHWRQSLPYSANYSPFRSVQDDFHANRSGQESTTKSESEAD
ncbi:MAG: hypothetical protein L6R40_004324 [Gallowayella cf. fulva]|nr:MAG: hypothetical protein L6R40_004324 [Xanthomendoza cf. fulva]